MTVRERLEELEYTYLSECASRSRESKGRDVYEPPCDIRPVYQRDRDRILHSKAFRRLKHKTQVFLTPRGDHYRTRLTHTLEVSQTARTIAKALHLNEDLVEAIALGHDLGHAPFGHAGERALNEVCSEGFTHYEQGLRIVEKLEKKGRGLNLTKEVRDGILNHRTSGSPSTLEGKVVRYADKIAYINHDIDDAIRAGILQDKDIPQSYRQILGNTSRERLNTLVHDVVSNSDKKTDIIMSGEIEEAMQDLRRFMFVNVYENPRAKGEETKAIDLLKQLFRYYKEHLSLLPAEYITAIEKNGESPDRAVCDYIAGMTDQYAVIKFQEFFIPDSWTVMG